MPPVRTLIVDDSALVRRIVADSLAHDPEIEVVGTAVDPYVARDKILALNPDVLTLDIEMPRMDGITFLKLIMKYRPMPVIIMSSLTTAGSQKALEALHAGAVEVVAKPGGTFSALDGTELAAKIKAAAQSRVRFGAASAGHTSFHPRTAPAPEPRAPQPLVAPAAGPAAASARPQARPSDGARAYAARQVILLGASTGGTEALRAVLTRLAPDVPGICIVQHIPAYFSAAFAARLNQLCQLEVREARAGDRVRPGLALVAPGGWHMVLRWHGSHYGVELSDGPQVHHQRPAVDVLFESAEKAGAGPHTFAALLTGMGSDGAAGLLRLRQAGAATVAQDEPSCVVFGMPKEAIRLGAARRVLPLDQIPACLESHASSVALGAPRALERA